VEELKLFLESCRSEETKKHYTFCIKKYFDFIGNVTFDNRKSIEDKIIEFIISLKKEGKSRAAIHNYVAPVKSFYSISRSCFSFRSRYTFATRSKKSKTNAYC